jgi:drug/metabolite transporter (DMT)-like permease
MTSNTTQSPSLAHHSMSVDQDEEETTHLNYNAALYQTCPPIVTNHLTGTEDRPTPRNGTLARILLVVVAFLYGTLNVALRGVYGLPGPPSASAISTARGWLAVVCFMPFLMLPTQKRNESSPIFSRREASLRPLWMVALELGFWNFAAQGLANAGLIYTTAARTAFLTQCSVVMTPILSFCFGAPPKRIVWVACIVALTGLAVLSGAHDTSSDEEETPHAGFGFGDYLVLTGALCWSCYIFRLSAIGDSYDEIQLQALKTVFMAVFYTIWFILAQIASPVSLWPGWASPLAWLILLYSAAGPGSIADILQQKGQAVVAAAESNVLISMEPVFTSILGRILLGEATSLLEKLGGGLIIAAAVLATR